LATTTQRPGRPDARTLLTSLALHAGVLTVLVLVPVGTLRRTAKPETHDVVFYREPPRIALPVPALPSAPAGGRTVKPGPGWADAPKTPTIAHKPSPEPPGDPLVPESLDMPPGPPSAPVAELTPRQKVGKAGILAYRDQIKSLSQDRVALQLGTNARYRDADDVGQASASSLLASTSPGSSGINVGTLSRNIGGGGGGGGGAFRGNGGGGGGGGDGMPGVPFGQPTSPIASIGEGDRPLARDGLDASRTDEEIQIVFDRHKASFYRLYNRELRRDPTLRGQMVLRLTIEPDGSVSMCTLQSTDMDAPELAAQVVDRVFAIDFGAKDVPALTIVYPIDFLPAA
jgi:hypothetical protein